MNGLTVRFGLSLAVASAALCVAPHDAEACGGTFCDNGPSAMPVEQTGENILFVLSGDTVEAHIQIQYDPETQADKFAWIVPVPEIPEFSIGSEALFRNLLGASVPTYGMSTMQEFCGQGEDDGGFDECAGDGDGDGGGLKLDLGGMGGPNDDPVVKQETVGAFELTVLDGNADLVLKWLEDEEFDPDPASRPILDEYIAEGFRFVAFQLTPGAEAEEIHPVVLTYPGNEPCVPIRLTRIAAQDDMEIRTMFLGRERVVPDGYMHVALNMLQLDWIAQGANYRELVSAAIDEKGSGGHGFVTEFAGPTDSLFSIETGVPADIWDPAWDAAPFAVASYVDAVHLLFQQGYMDCSVGGCQTIHSLMDGLLAQYLPVPDGVDPDNFYQCPECYAEMFDAAAWDGVAFATALQERLIDPGLKAAGTLEASPYFTRMYTLLSPHEMTRDPMFQEREGLDDVALSANATRNLWCDGSSSMDLADGRLVALLGPNAWPDFGDEMPWAERIEFFGPAGAPVIEVDNRELIDELLRRHNALYGPVRGGPNCDDGGNPSTAGADDSDGAGDGEARPGGCACGLSGASGPAALALGLCGLVLARSPRRRGLPME